MKSFFRKTQKTQRKLSQNENQNNERNPLQKYLEGLEQNLSRNRNRHSNRNSNRKNERNNKINPLLTEEKKNDSSNRSSSRNIPLTPYLGKLEKIKDFSLTPKRPTNNTEMILDEDTIVLFMNTHGSLIENLCINLSDYKNIDFFQKVYIGIKGCVNIINVNKNYVIDFINYIKQNKNKNFLTICRTLYKYYVRKTPKEHFKHIMKFVINENVKPTLFADDHHSSFIYDKYISNQNTIYNKRFSTIKEDIKISIDNDNKLKNMINDIKDIIEVNKRKLIFYKKQKQNKNHKSRTFFKSRVSKEQIQNLEKIREVEKEINDFEEKIKEINKPTPFPGIIVLFDGKKKIIKHNNDITILKEFEYYFMNKKDDITKPMIFLLSDLIESLIKDGYKKIFIYDPTCNSYREMNSSKKIKNCIPSNSEHF